MSETLRYGIEPASGHELSHDRLYVDVPQKVVEQADLAKQITGMSARRRRLLDVSHRASGQRLYLNTKKIARETQRTGTSAAERVVQVLAELQNYANMYELQDPQLNVQWGGRMPGDGRMGLHIDMQWPEVSDESLTKIATHHMRQTALKLHAVRKDWVDSMVYAAVSRERGITLESPGFSCSLETDGSEYDPRDERASLWGHNLYSSEQQLICFTGALAIAAADKLIG